MKVNPCKLIAKGSLLLGSALFYGPALYAAVPVDLNSEQNISILQTLISSRSGLSLQETKRSVDFKKTLHVRLKQTYKGYSVHGGEVILHIPNADKNLAASVEALVSVAKGQHGTVDGTLYQKLDADLANTPAAVFTSTQANKVAQLAIQDYQHKLGTAFAAKKQQNDLIVYIDDNNQAHWAYKISFYVDPVKVNTAPAKPVYIIDANSMQIYKSWNDIKNETFTNVLGGGNGGNKKMGKLSYDGLDGDLAALNVKRNDDTKSCYWQNDDVTVSNFQTNKVMVFPCVATDPNHNNVYWMGDMDKVNDGYSPADDALYAGEVIKGMYKKWYGLEVLTNSDGSPMMLQMVIHYPNYDNAYWDGSQMTFGDGFTMFYPLTSLGVAAHEISHGFTEQHSNLEYDSQSGGMNEAFSDMAAQAAEFYSYGKNSWQIGPEIFKKENEALRYMDQPSKDCPPGSKPGDWCSIDDASQYYAGLDVHFSSGVYNHFFYLLGTSQGWDTKKAFDVMVKANADYWTATTNFKKGACGVIKAARDYGYDLTAINAAFEKVKVAIPKNC